MDPGDSECAAVQGAAGSDYGSSSHSGDRNGIVSLPADARQREERRETAGGEMSCGNDGRWKDWKAKSRLAALSTVLGKPATAAGFPHSHSSDDWSLFKRRLSTAGLTAEPRTVNSEGGPEQNAEVGQNHLPKPAGIRFCRPGGSEAWRHP